jgi:hypothetical protein
MIISSSSSSSSSSSRRRRRRRRRNTEEGMLLLHFRIGQSLCFGAFNLLTLAIILLVESDNEKSLFVM